jgi:hypothetical protein
MPLIVDETEWYPFYMVVEDKYAPTSVVPAELVERWTKVTREWVAIQHELETIYKKENQ